MRSFLLKSGLLLTLLGLGTLSSLVWHQKPSPHLNKTADVISSKPSFRTVVLMLDSVDVEDAFNGTTMPFVSSLRSQSLWGKSLGCPLAATFPCTKSLFEGRLAPTGTTLQNFSSGASENASWPEILSKKGYRIAAASDQTLNRLYPGSYVKQLDYGTLDIPVLERDPIAFAKTQEWLSDPSLDIFMIHILGTDKIGHAAPRGSAPYLKKYAEVDDFVRDVANRLTPTDYLYILSDHGHTDDGGHTRDSMYLIRGPFFPEAVRFNLSSVDMLPLLGAPYQLALPIAFEGTLHTKLLQWTEKERLSYLADQANIWGIPIAGDADTLEKSLNVELSRRTVEAAKNTARQDLFYLLPWLSAMLLVLVMATRIPFPEINFLKMAIGITLAAVATRYNQYLAWIAPAVILFELRRYLRTILPLTIAGFLTLLITFALVSSKIAWLHRPQNNFPGMIIFLGGATFLAAIISWMKKLKSPKTEETLWMVMIFVWLTACFGIYFYSLARIIPVVLLIALSIFVLLSENRSKIFSNVRSWFVLGILVLMVCRAESYNIGFIWLEKLAVASASTQNIILALLASALAFFLQNEKRVASLIVDLFSIALWIFLSVGFFEFGKSQVAGFLIGVLGFVGLVEIIRHTKLPERWVGLAFCVTALMIFWVSFNGFALSRLDFRFAMDRIFDVRLEIYRAGQLLAWVYVKYLMVIVPLLLAASRMEVSLTKLMTDTARLVWWRLLAAIVLAWGLRLFGAPGVYELSSEEIYFWAYLAVIAWIGVAILSSIRTLRPAR